MLERYARCAELAGELPEAVKAWRELSAVRSARGERLGFADAQRRLAAAYELKGEPESAFAARRVAAETFSEGGRPADAAVERLAMANHRRVGADFSEAMELARLAATDADRAGRADLRARALGLEGVARAKRGEFEAGLETVRSGLAVALAERSDGGRRRALPAARPRALRLGRLPPRRGGARHRARPLPARRRRGHRDRRA